MKDDMSIRNSQREGGKESAHNVPLPRDCFLHRALAVAVVPGTLGTSKSFLHHHGNSPAWKLELECFFKEV